MIFLTDNNLLLSRIREGDEPALEELIRANMGLVRSVALRFRDRGTEYEDLIQIGTIGLMRAARSFDFSYGCVFSTYAVPLIIGEIRRFLRDDGIIKISRSIKSRGILALRRKEEFINENGYEPSTSQLAGLCDISCEELVQALEAVSPVRSLSERVGEDSATLESFVADTDNSLDRLTDSIALKQAVSRLSEFHRRIVELRYFRDLSQQKTGELLGITQVKVSREEKKILQILRSYLPH